MIGSGIFVLIILPIIGTFISLIIDDLLNFPNIIISPFNYIPSSIILIFGFIWALWSNVAIYKLGEGSPVPRKDTETIKLVRNGPYKYSRNPTGLEPIVDFLGLC